MTWIMRAGRLVALPAATASHSQDEEAI